jgi:hypothetical protein
MRQGARGGLDVSMGESSEVADGENADWLDNDTLIVAPVS